MTEQREWWTVAELAEHYRLSESKVYQLVDSGELPCLRAPAIRVHDSDRLEWERRRFANPKRTKRRRRQYIPRVLKP